MARITETKSAKKKNKGYNSVIAFIFCDKYSSRNHADLFKLDSRFVKVDIQEFCLSLNIKIDNGIVELKSTTYDLDKIRDNIVYYAPYSYESIYFSPLAGDTSYHFAKRQLSTLVLFVEGWLEENCHVINSPSSGRQWSNKLYQLAHLQRELNKNIIPTLITSDYNLLSVNSIIKHLSEGRMVTKSITSHCLVVTADLISTLQTDKVLPVINQAIVVADCEYRCYVMNDNYVLVCFSRASLYDGEVDIHSVNAVEGVEINPISKVYMKLIAGIRQSCGLKYFAVDIFNDNNTLKIIEINPLFTWHTLSATLCRNISKTFLKSITHDRI